MIGYGPPMVGFRDYEADGQDLAPIAIRWADGTPVATMGILGDPAKWAEQKAERLAEEAERAEREEAISLANNIYLLDNYRR